MKNFLFLLFILANISYSQYSPVSPYLNFPGKVIPYVDSCAVFWEGVYDSVNGGFYTNVDRTGKVISSWGLNKNLVNQSRDAYGFTRAFMLTGNEKYLTMARHALDFMYANSWDEVNKGWVNEIDNLGNKINPSSDKVAFDQHYALVGISAYFEATGDTLDWNWMMKGYESNENLWDDDSVNFGYYDYGNYNWSAVNGKSFNATVDAITTHVLALYLMTHEEKYKIRLLQLADNIKNRLYESMLHQRIGFVESYTSDWAYNTSETMTIMGHVLKSAWCLGRIYQLFPDSSYLKTAEALFDNVWENGYDHEYGGPYKDFNRTNGEMLMWGQQDTAKAWWQMEQAVTAGLMLYNITGNQKYIKTADETLNFFMNFFVDHQYGEVYSDRTRTGKQIWGDEKGSSGKAAYHSIELGYYTYLYGNLIYKKQPATLHYKFSPLTINRDINLNPIAFNTDKYIINKVLKDGELYTDFEADKRILHLPAGEGGHFTVTFEETEPVQVAENNSHPLNFELSQNYPNPFNPSTVIEYSIPAEGKVSIKVFDLLGKQVAELVNEEKPAGSYSIIFNSSDKNLSSGVYFYRLESEGLNFTKKMLLLK